MRLTISPSVEAVKATIALDVIRDVGEGVLLREVKIWWDVYLSTLPILVKLLL